MTVHKIYCYYVDIGWKAQGELMPLWKERWRAEGWEPIVLGEDDARKDPRWDALTKKSEELPCISTSRGFERVCMRRWLAFSQIEGPAAVADFDVFPIRHFPPRDFGNLPICGDGSGGPGFIVGLGSDFSKVAEAILSYQAEPDDVIGTTPHVSEMRVMWKRKASLYRIEVLVITYGMKNFGTVPLAHYGNASLDAMTNFHTAMPKAEAIRLLLKQHYR